MIVEEFMTNILLREDGINPQDASPEQRDRV
jgi:hypothetical protein